MGAIGPLLVGDFIERSKEVLEVKAGGHGRAWRSWSFTLFGGGRRRRTRNSDEDDPSC